MATLLGQALPASAGLLASAARTAAVQAEFAVPNNAVGIEVRMDVTADPGTAAVVATIQAYDIAAAEWFDILASASIAAAGTTNLVVDPRIAASTNAVAQRGLKPKMRVSITVADTESLTYSVSVFAYA